METTSTLTFFSIITIVTAILEIILFFKIWIMTNDVNSIKDTIKSKGITTKSQIAYLKGNKEEAKDLLLTAVYTSMLEYGKESLDNTEFNRFLINIDRTYKPIFEKMGFDMIDLVQYVYKKNLPI